uniref:Uncharacterized protein n=1 Tax=Panagrolaimus sp. JU765 TaxID=591449 RepID=A0AC34QDF8_9BILA
MSSMEPQQSESNSNSPNPLFSKKRAQAKVEATIHVWYGNEWKGVKNGHPEVTKVNEAQKEPKINLKKTPVSCTATYVSSAMTCGTSLGFTDGIAYGIERYV